MKPTSQSMHRQSLRDCLHRRPQALAWLAACAALLAAEIRGQPRALTFEQISIEQGLSQSIVFCVMQDRTGFMWFGTEDGLNKYDGYNFTIFRHDPHDANSLSYNEIRALHQDREGMFWIGTFYGGLSKYDPNQQRFTHYRNVPGDSASLSHNNIKALYEDKSGALWIGTEGGLNRWQRDSGKFLRYQHEVDDPSSLSNNVVNAIYEDHAGVLWIGTDGGLNALVQGNNGALPNFRHYRHAPADRRSLSHDVITAIHADCTGRLWIGTTNGLNELERVDHENATASFKRYLHDPANPQSLSHNDVRAIFADSAEVLWIGTNGGGLNLFDRAAGRFMHYQNDPQDPTSVSYDQVYAICRDRSGIIWLGTYGGGASKSHPRRKQFALYRPEPGNANSLPQEIVWTIYEDEAGMLWLGTHGGGLTRFDRTHNQYTHFQNDQHNPQSLSNDFVRLVYPARRDPQVLWIGTHGGGLNKFDTRTRRFTRYLYEASNPTSLSHNELRSLYEDQAGALWIGTNGGGLNRLVPSPAGSAPAFKRYVNDPNDSTSLSNDFVRVIHEDPQDAGAFLWIGTQGGGLNKFHRATETFTHFRAEADKPKRLNNDFIFCIHADQAGVLWIGTWGGGLNRFDRATNEFKAYTTREGLPSNEIYGILEDGEGAFWISTNRGLSRFNPQTEVFKNYSVEDGLQSNEFNGGAFYKSKSGEMFFGGIHGFNAFFPQQIKDNPHVPPVAITGFFKFNKAVRLEPAIAATKLLELSHRDYVFSFEFAALDFTAPMKNQYAYKMEGLDHDWIYTDAKKRFATYTTLSPGTYTFRVKGSNNDGIWNETGAALAIAIHPPLWKTAWFRILATLLAGGLVYLGYRERVKHVRIKAELKTAHEAQMSIMPQADPEIPGLDLSGVCMPANEVGGDFFDYLWLDEARTKFGIAIGDVSGKAMQAAMTAVMANGMIYAKADEGLSIREIMTRLNRPLFHKTERHMFTALCLAAFDLRTKTLTFSNAGLIEPLLKRDGEVISLHAVGTTNPLGILYDNVYEESTLPLQSGDVLFFVTDGITEELNAAQEFYEEAGLKRLLRAMNTTVLSAKAIKEKILADVKRFSGGTLQDDDMTVVVMKVL